MAVKAPATFGQYYLYKYVSGHDCITISLLQYMQRRNIAMTTITGIASYSALYELSVQLILCDYVLSYDVRSSEKDDPSFHCYINYISRNKDKIEKGYSMMLNRIQ